MNKQEFGTFAMALRTYFPRYNMLPNPQAMELWFRELGDLPYELACAALRRWVSTEKWPPSIAELRSAAGELRDGPPADWGEGWQELQRAVRRFGWAREREAMDALSPAARTAAQRIGWQDICMSENPETLRAQFRQVFQSEVRRERQDALLPPELKRLIAGLGKSALPENSEFGIRNSELRRRGGPCGRPGTRAGDDDPSDLAPLGHLPLEGKAMRAGTSPAPTVQTHVFP